MELTIIRSRVCLLLVFCCLSWFAVAQTSDNDDKKLLLGEWLWDETTIPDDEHPISFDLHNTYFQFYDEIEIDEDMVMLKDSEETLKVKYEIVGNFLGLNFPSGKSFMAEWAIVDNKLYLEFNSLHPYNKSKKVNVLIVYKQNR